MAGINIKEKKMSKAIKEKKNIKELLKNKKKELDNKQHILKG